MHAKGKKCILNDQRCKIKKYMEILSYTVGDIIEETTEFSDSKSITSEEMLFVLKRIAALYVWYRA